MIFHVVAGLVGFVCLIHLLLRSISEVRARNREISSRPNRPIHENKGIEDALTVVTECFADDLGVLPRQIYETDRFVEDLGYGSGALDDPLDEVEFVLRELGLTASELRDCRDVSDIAKLVVAKGRSTP